MYILLCISYSGRPIKSRIVYRKAPFSVTLSDIEPRFQGYGDRNAFNVVCAQLTSDLFAIAKFLVMWPTMCGHIMKRCGCLSVRLSVCLSVCLSRVISRKRSQIEP